MISNLHPTYTARRQKVIELFTAGKRQRDIITELKIPKGTVNNIIYRHRRKNENVFFNVDKERWI